MLSGTRRRLLCRAFVFARLLAIPVPDGPVVWPTVFFAFEAKTRNPAKDLEPGCGVAADLDLRLNRAKRVERLVEQVAHHARLGSIVSCSDIVDREVVVNPQVALDETRHLPRLASAVEVLQNENVAAAGGPTIAFAPTLLVRVRQRRADCVAQCRGILRAGGPDTVRETSLFHAVLSRTE